MMNNMTYSDFRSHLTAALDRVNDDHVPLLITRRSGKPAVVMSLEDFKSYQETTYLMASPANAERLMESLKQLEQDGGQAHNIIEK